LSADLTQARAASASARRSGRRCWCPRARRSRSARAVSARRRSGTGGRSGQVLDQGLPEL